MRSLYHTSRNFNLNHLFSMFSDLNYCYSNIGKTNIMFSVFGKIDGRTDTPSSWLNFDCSQCFGIRTGWIIYETVGIPIINLAALEKIPLNALDK